MGKQDPASGAAQRRQERLAESLRANLRKRKVQDNAKVKVIKEAKAQAMTDASLVDAGEKSSFEL